MKKQMHLIYTADGQGYANNMAACNEYAKSHGLRSSQCEVRILEHDNYCQAAGLFVTDAAKAKVRRQQQAARDAQEEW